VTMCGCHSNATNMGILKIKLVDWLDSPTFDKRCQESDLSCLPTSSRQRKSYFIKLVP
jgi:hypothetical protein